jgi:hypothetical protein
MLFENNPLRALRTTSRIPSTLRAIEEHARERIVFGALMTSPIEGRMSL